LSRRAEKDRAFAAKQAADELINFMQYDLSDTLGKLGRLDMMKAINGRIRKYHEDHPPEASDLDALRETAVSFTQQSDLQRARAIFLARLRATATALPSLRSLPSRTSAMHSGNWI
jgi:hypothetical protein